MSTDDPKTEEKKKANEELSPGRWWFKNVLVPVLGLLLGTGGIATFVLRSGSHDEGKGGQSVTPPKPQHIGSITSGKNTVVTNGDIKGPIVAGDFIESPKVSAQKINRKIVLHENDSRTVQGILIETGQIVEGIAELSISDGNAAVVPMQKVRDGKHWVIRNNPDDKIEATVESVELVPKDPKMTWDQLQKLWILAEGLVTRKVTIAVTGESMSLDSPEEAEKDKQKIQEEKVIQDYMISFPVLGAVDARTMSQDQLPTQLSVGISENDWQKVRVVLSLLKDIDTTVGDGRTPLMHAVLFDRVDMFKYILEKGANPDAPCKGEMTVRKLLMNHPEKKEFVEALEDFDKKKK